MTIIRKYGDEDIFWNSAFFWKVLWKPDGIDVVKVVNRSVKKFVIVESFWQEEVGVLHVNHCRFFPCYAETVVIDASSRSAAIDLTDVLLEAYHTSP